MASQMGKFVEVVNWWEDTNFLQLFNKGAFILGVPTVGSPLGVEPSKPRALQQESMRVSPFHHKDSWRFFGVFQKGMHQVFVVLPFRRGRALTPIMLLLRLRLWLCIADRRWTPMVEGIDCMLDLTEQRYKASLEEDQFKSALEARWCPSSLLRQGISWVCPSAFC